MKRQDGTNCDSSDLDSIESRIADLEDRVSEVELVVSDMEVARKSLVKGVKTSIDKSSDFMEKIESHIKRINGFEFGLGKVCQRIYRIESALKILDPDHDEEDS